MVHKHLDTWLDQMALLFEQQRPPTLLELSALFTRTGASLLGGCLQALAEALYGQLREQRQMDYPECAERLSRKRTDTQQINGLHGPFALELTGVAVSNHQGHATLSRVADSADLPTVIPDDSQIRRRIEQAKASAQKKPMPVAALDGAHAATRPRAWRNQKRGTGQWRQVKGIRLYLAPADGRIIQVPVAPL